MTAAEIFGQSVRAIALHEGRARQARMNLAYNLKALREVNKFGLREAARVLGFDSSYLRRVERGEVAASGALLEAAAEVYEMPNALDKPNDSE